MGSASPICSPIPGDRVLGWGALARGCAPPPSDPMLGVAKGERCQRAAGTVVSPSWVAELGQPQSQPPQGQLAAGSPLPGCRQGDHSPCACSGRTRPPRLLMRTSGPGGLQGDTRGGQLGMKVEAGREETVPSCMGTVESQGLLGFWGHFGRYLGPTPPSGPDPTQGRGSLPGSGWVWGQEWASFSPSPTGGCYLWGSLGRTSTLTRSGSTGPGSRQGYTWMTVRCLHWFCFSWLQGGCLQKEQAEL